MILEIEARSPASKGGPQLEAPDEFLSLTGQFNLVSIGMAFLDLEYAAEKPDIGFVVKLHQREDIWPVEIITLWAVFLPTSPCALVA